MESSNPKLQALLWSFRDCFSLAKERLFYENIGFYIDNNDYGSNIEKQHFYEKELSESIDEHYLSVLEARFLINLGFNKWPNPWGFYQKKHKYLQNE